MKFALGSAAKPAFIAALSTQVRQPAAAAAAAPAFAAGFIHAATPAISWWRGGAKLRLVTKHDRVRESWCEINCYGAHARRPAATTFADLLALAVSEKSSDERAALGELPVTVRACCQSYVCSTTMHV